jgi:DNA-binding beta-propeller fold protein YncE
MKTSSQPKKSNSCSGRSGLRVAAATILVLAAAALAAKSMIPPKLPWAMPTVAIGVPGEGLAGVAVDPATNTIYVAHGGTFPRPGTIAIIDGSNCNEDNHSRCSSIATMNAGLEPLFLLFDQTTSTLYVTNALTATGDPGNTITVLNGKTCNAKNTSGCGQTGATVTVPGVLISDVAAALMALDTATHSLYVGDANEGAVSIINTGICNGTNMSGCSLPAIVTSTNGDTITIDPANHSIYVGQFVNDLVFVFDGTTCNATNTSKCSQPPSAIFAVNGSPAFAGAIDDTMHTFYLPLAPADPNLLFSLRGHVAVIDTSTCNAAVASGCGNTPPMVEVGTTPEGVIFDPGTKTVYVLNGASFTISMFNGATCNAGNHSGCGQKVQTLATGEVPDFYDLNLKTHTFYATSQDTNSVWVLDASKCNATHTSGCTKFAPTTTVGVGPVEVAENPNTKTLYETNQIDNTVSVIDTMLCNEDNLTGCNQTWPTIPAGTTSRHIGINKITNTIYVSNRDDNTLSVINGATCNRSITSGCGQLQPTTAVGNVPQQIAVDEMTNTIYVVNQGDGTVSVINGVHCNGADASGCSQSWPTATVGNSPQAVRFNPNTHTIYVTNTGDNTVSVINGIHCNRSDASGCVSAATFPVGAAPRSVGIVLDKNTIFIGNRDDLTVSVIDGSSCNGSNTVGCPQVPPPAVLVGAFPSTAGINDNILGRSIAVDQKNHRVFIPAVGDADVAMLDGNACRAGHVDSCHVKIVHERMGAFPVMATVDESSGTVYVTNDDDATVSLFPSGK